MRHSNNKDCHKLLVLLALSVLVSCQRPSQELTLVLWSWERPEDLSYIDPLTERVAVLVATVTLANNDYSLRPNLNPITVPVSTHLTSVVRIEGDDILKAEKISDLATDIIDSMTPVEFTKLQIDFDALQSQREFYRRLLLELSDTITRENLSITALASWCLDDNWVDGLPIAYATPMLFRMGQDAGEIRHRLNSGENFRAAKCQDSIGFSLDEPFTKIPNSGFVFLFNPKTWNYHDFTHAKQTLID